MTAATEREVEDFFYIANGFTFSQGIAAGVENNVFGFLNENPGTTLDKISEACGLPHQSARALMIGLGHMKLIERDPKTKTYKNKPVADEYLVAKSPKNIIPIIRAFWRIQYKGLYHMPTALKKGTNLGVGDPTEGGGEETLYKRLAHDPELEKIFHEAMNCFTIQTNEHLGKFDDWKTVKHVVDVGGGTGTNSVMLAKTHSNLRMTVFDAPTICERAKERFKANGVQDRCDTHVGEFFKDPFPTGIDGILFSHVAEIYSPEQVQFAAKKSYDALPKGGKLFLWVVAADDDEMGGTWAVKISLYFLTQASGQGICYPPNDYEAWLKGAGFSDVKVTKGLPWEHAFIVATK